MRPRLLVFITLLALCHLQVAGQTLTNGLPPAETVSDSDQNGKDAGPAVVVSGSAAATGSDALPEDPGQEMLPIAEPEPEPATGIPIRWEAQRQSRVGDDWTLSGEVVVSYRDYVFRADKVVFHQSNSELEAEGHLQLSGGPEDVQISASRGEMRLKMHTARFYDVTGSMGVRSAGRTTVYSTTNPLRFSGRVVLQTGEGHYRVIDGSITNCHLPKPDWKLISRSIDLNDNEASTTNTVFKFFGVPIFYIPYLRHPVDEIGRQSGLLIPIPGNSSIKGFILGEQAYWVISRSMDMTVGMEYYSRRGWAPNGDFRYRGSGLDHLTVRWNGLFDRGVRGVKEVVGVTGAQEETVELVSHSGADVTSFGRKDFSDETRLAGKVEYLSSYAYRLVFNESYSQAISSEVASDLALTHAHNGFIASGSFARFQSFASSTPGDEVRLLHLPNLRFDVLSRPLGTSGLYAGLGSSVGFLNRAEPKFHARNLGRLDFYPHLWLPFSSGGWTLLPEVALRNTFYSTSQYPDLSSTGDAVPTVRHELVNRTDVEAAVNLRPPAVERDFTFAGGNRILRHVIEPELSYRYVTGIGTKAREVIRVDTADIASDTNELGYSLTQRFYLRTTAVKPCDADGATDANTCPAQARQWASWQIAQKFYIDPKFGGALISERRNIFDSTLDLTGVAFLTSPRNLAPLTSRLRFEAINNLRVEWDLDYDPKAGRINADNIFAGYSWGRTTVGVGHALLNAVEESGNAASNIRSQIVQPYLAIGKPSGKGFNLAANAGYDFVLDSLQYAGVQAVFNWDCCGLTVGYRRFQLGLRDEVGWLYGFTIANFGTAGDVRRTNSVFRDSSLPPAY
jgi:LPS-assembly protein